MQEICFKQIIPSLGQSLHSSTNGSPHPVKKIQKNFKNNYASVECGAKILAANNEAKVMHSVANVHFSVNLALAGKQLNCITAWSWH